MLSVKAIAVGGLAGIANGVFSGALGHFIGSKVSSLLESKESAAQIADSSKVPAYVGGVVSVIVSLFLFFTIFSMFGGIAGGPLGANAYYMAGTVALVMSGALTASVGMFDGWINKLAKWFPHGSNTSTSELK